MSAEGAIRQTPYAAPTELRKSLWERAFYKYFVPPTGLVCTHRNFFKKELRNLLHSEEVDLVELLRSHGELFLATAMTKSSAL